MFRFGAPGFDLPSFDLWSDRSAGAGGASEDAGLTEMRDFGDNPGRLAMKAYVPKGLKPGAPLVVALHGCTQLAGGYQSSARWTALADAYGFALLCPEQRRSNNPKLCFSWFRPDDVTRGKGEAASIRAMIEALATTHALDRRRVFVTGLSAGGAMACALLATYPEVFAAGSIVAGLPYGAAGGVGEAFAAMGKGVERSASDWGDRVRAASGHAGPWPRVMIWQGEADETVNPANAEALVRQWTDLHALSPASLREERRGNVTRRRWGDGAVEEIRIAGMGHGAPLDGAEGEVAAPYMLDVGVSQALETLAFWGLTRLEALRRPRASPTPKPARTAPPAARPTSGGTRRAIKAAVTRALRAVGVIR
ncbi:LpqC, poly [Methylopila jiangsuensis]|uniref:LpqC, poly n=1 Tax=Methylopila jiangsuensis TaxID=586230 RepID=A0A9W6N4P5_9HYPH|nr:PHB depolymerase family esterase [Methylopila jiangsuensis]MDR6285068.1 poly(hydroxyalkanoate) depolymerase family esterase [Methylopila jiangsuensis]GLK77545.1 LpqC, poly [Methylopila jiangsuensis]